MASRPVHRRSSGRWRPVRRRLSCLCPSPLRRYRLEPNVFSHGRLVKVGSAVPGTWRRTRDVVTGRCAARGPRRRGETARGGGPMAELLDHETWLVHAAEVAVPTRLF